jgi:ribose-phosphate pyrophosphokinase
MPRRILILADKKGKMWEFTKEVYNKLVNNPHRTREYELGEVEITKFNDGEIFSKILTNVRLRTCFYFHDSSMNPQDGLISLFQVNDALKRSSASKINNVIPYMSYSRQDRMTEPRVPITARIVANLISAEAQRVITTDLHNPAITGFYKIPFDNLKGYIPISEYLKENCAEFLENAVILAPDVGCAKMAGSYAKRLSLGVVLADKERKKAGEIGDLKIVGDVSGKNVIIPDDMIDTGGTLIKAAEEAKKQGANKIYVCATHGLFSKGVQELMNSSIEKIIITDSIPQDRNGKIVVVSLRNLFSETIHRISHGGSVSELFR